MKATSKKVTMYYNFLCKKVTQHIYLLLYFLIYVIMALCLSLSVQMEAFVVLFFTFVCQHIQTLQKSAANAFTWLQSDSNLEQIQEYFPSHIIHGIQPNIKNPVQLRLSVLLNAFQQFVTTFEALICENKSLESRAKLLQDLVERSTKLEDEIQEYRRRETQMVKNPV